jgi:predicted ATPase/transcriptional regulator with XRE-family HTH domain
MSVPRDAVTFGSLLRAHRLAAGLTQEVLAERSGVSPRSIQQLEASNVRPHRSTARFLAGALGLSDRERRDFENAASAVPRQQVSHDPRPPRTIAARIDSDPIPISSGADAGRDRAVVAMARPAPTNIPWPVSSLIGREPDITAIRALIADDGQRLITLTGVGGSGKTRLAVQVAAELLSAFADGVWFVELAATSSPALVPRTVAGALSVREMEHAPILDTLLGFLRRKSLLLILDNCEHLIDACAALAHRLLTACPDLHILATSREPLRIAGERRWQVQPLAVPDLGGAVSFEALAGTAAVRLFVERAQAIDAEFTLTEANAASVAQICARLDGIPLAIELAASRIGVLTAAQIAERLEDDFRLLAGGARGGPSRLQTMQAALTWSYDLLSASEQAAFRLLSAFAGGFHLEAAETICSLDTGDGPDVLDTLSRLVDKSLVVADRTPRGRRYRLLEPVRQYAQHALLNSGDEASARARHATYYAVLAERASPLLRGTEQIQWLERLEVERDNLRAALGWITEHSDPDTGLRLVAAMTPYWEARGYLTEGRRWLETMLTVSRAGGASRDTLMRARMAAGRLAQWQADLKTAESLLTETLAAARVLGDRHGEAETLGWLSAAYWQQDSVQRGLLVGEECLKLAHELADETLITFGLLNVGVASHRARETARAVTLLDECARRYRQLGDARYAAIASTMLGWALLTAGEHNRAGRILRENLVTLRVVGDQRFIVITLRNLAHIAQAQGEPRQAARLFAASEALREALAMDRPPQNQANDPIFRASLQEQLSASEFDEAYAAGETMTLDEVLADIDEAP